MRLTFYFAISVLVVLSHAIVANAQAAKCELVGEVRDQAGSVIAQASLTLTETATGLISKQRAEDGNYTITNLKPGFYHIAVEADGFKQTVREGVRLATGERVRLDFVLEPGAVSETVTVNQDASLLRTESGSL